MAERILITGGSNGLGASLAALDRQRGAAVTVLDREAPQPAEEHEYIELDLGAVPDGTWPRMPGPFDIVICNAGISVSGDFIEIPDDAERDVMAVNFTGHMRLVKHLLRERLIAPGGRIAFICSATRFLSFPIALAYSASKGALDGFAQALESYLVKDGISVTRVYPGPMNTGHSRYYPGARTTGGRLPEQSAPGIVRAIDRRRRQVCPDPVSRFYCLAAKFVPRMLARKAYKFYEDRMSSSCPNENSL